MANDRIELRQLPQLVSHAATDDVVGSSLPGIPKCVSRVGLSSGRVASMKKDTGEQNR
jgi:hypothetical protein